MPWFITAICSRETMQKLESIQPDHRYLPSKSRTFGFYTHYTDAFNAVVENRSNMCESLCQNTHDPKGSVLERP